LPLTGSGTKETVAGITREQVARFHQTRFKPNGATLIVVGDTTLAEIQPKLESLFASWNQGPCTPVQLKTIAGPQKAAVYLIDKPGALQSVIMSGSIAPPANSPDEVALEAVNNAFGGTFSARLNMNLREDKHWSYGATALLYGARGQRPYLAVAGVQTDKTKEAIAETLKELRDIIDSRPVAESELERIKTQTILELAGSRETMNSIGGAIADLIEYGWPDNYWETYPARVKALDTAQVHKAAQALINPDRFIWVIVGDRALIEKDVASLGLGEITHITADGMPDAN
jgi:zinc protease